MAWRNPYYDASLKHHTPTGFRNPVKVTRGAGDFMRWQRERRAQQVPRAPVGGYSAFIERWWQRADFSGNSDAAWWLGHACVLIRVGGLHVLTDPVLHARASPLPFVGPARRTPVPASINELPAIDVVLISHNHYDHLDRRSVRELARRFPHATFVVPLGLAQWLRRHDVARVHELDWWQSIELAGARFHAVPAQHWSSRTPWDRNRSLWCGWVMHAPVADHGKPFRFYFAGDTGYGEWLGEIGARLGPFDLAALPIGAYAPRWFMHGQHVDPAEAVRLHRELKSALSLPIHWGTFELADDALDEPPRLLAEALREQGVASAAFPLLRIGARLDLAPA